VPHDWDSVAIDTEMVAVNVFAELHGKRWLCRGHPERCPSLVPSIDRESLQNLSRIDKLRLERRLA
jgi:hypothetical protein